jgi:hypothetical protein
MTLRYQPEESHSCPCAWCDADISGRHYDVVCRLSIGNGRSVWCSMTVCKECHDLDVANKEEAAKG